MIGVGLLAALAAVVATTVGAALARAVGVDLEVTGGEAIPVSGVAFVTGVFSLAGVALAVALRRWSGRPARVFVVVTVALTALSLVPPVLAATSAATAATLVVLHLAAAAVVVPTLTRRLRTPTG